MQLKTWGLLRAVLVLLATRQWYGPRPGPG